MSPIVSYQYLNAVDEQGTTLASPIVSFQFLSSLGEAATTVFSRIVGYQYLDWAGNDALQLESSDQVSYYYQFLNVPPLVIIPTNRTATATEVSPSVVLPGPDPWQLKTFTNGMLRTNVAPDSNWMSVVLTHGWNSSPEAWATNMAQLISANATTSANILIWDWTSASQSTPCLSLQADFVGAARLTPDQGFALAMALRSKLGTNYSHQIHFIGHSLGALVNGFAAIYLHHHGFAPTNTQITMFDEAEVATDLSCPELLNAVLFNQWNPLSPKPYYCHPLPRQFAWADNYITAFGLLHPDAHNVILTNGFPGNAANLINLGQKLANFHSYPCDWYAETVSSNNSAMGHQWSFEQGGFSGGRDTNTVFRQSFNGSLWNLAELDYAAGSNYLAGRFEKYRDAVKYAVTNKSPSAIAANGIVFGFVLLGLTFDGFVLYLQTSAASPQVSEFPRQGSHGHDGGAGGNGSTGACAWLRLPIPADGVSISFDFKVDGDWQDDSLAAALNGTNLLLLAASQVETNIVLNSGLIDIRSYAGQTNELFVGIVGGTSTNALLTVGNVAIYTAAVPSLHGEVSGRDFNISWPLTAQNFNLESTTNLELINSWTAVTNTPAIVNFQNIVTNDASTDSRFYRLRKY